MSPSSLNLKGVFTALITPFSKDGSAVDYESFERLIAFQMKSGVDGFVVCGSTGEAATLSDVEYYDVVKFVREQTKSRYPCVAGISVSSTSRAIDMARSVEELGCDGILVATPPYNKPSQAGLIAHFKAIHSAVKIPLVAYNIPGRSGVPISASTLGVLSREGVITAIKESSGSIDALADTMTTVLPTCQVVSGDDSLTLAVLAYGGTGVISASANAMPADFVKMISAWTSGGVIAAKNVQLSILAKLRVLFIESNPVPVKSVLALQGIIAHPAVRLPLVDLAPINLEKLRVEFGI